MKQIACLVLAAGASSRFGACKQLAIIDKKPLILHCLDALEPLFQSDLFILLGAYSDEIKPIVGGSAQVIKNDHWSEGIGNSIARGISYIEQNGAFDGVLIALADQYRLTKADYKKLLNQFDGDQIVTACYEDTIGVPAIFPASSYYNLKQLQGDRGAKSLLLSHQNQVVTVPLPHAKYDLDTREDLLRNNA